MPLEPGRSRTVICSPRARACVEKGRKERETIHRSNRTDVRRQKVMRHQFLPDQYLFHDQIIREQIEAVESTLFLSPPPFSVSFSTCLFFARSLLAIFWDKRHSTRIIIIII